MSAGDATLRPPIVVIAGPTASGKTRAALELARHVGGELVGADSVQVYRGFDIGSAKPSAAELGDVTHHLIDILEPDEAIDAMGFAARADAAIEEIAGRGATPIVVGGTGLWIRALVRGLVDVPPVDPALRARLEAETEARGAPAMHAELLAVDPLGAEAIHPNDALRIVRALEVYHQTGEPMGELRRRHALGALRYPTLFVVLDHDRELLTERIENRLGAMLAAGWVHEVQTLLECWPPDARAFGSVGYRQIVAHLGGTLSAEELQPAIRTATRKYARRQRTWFRNERGIDWRTTPEGLREGWERVSAHLSTGPPKPP